jgi:hypothetical protein
VLKSLIASNFKTELTEKDAGIPAIGPGAVRPPVKELWTPEGQ